MFSFGKAKAKATTDTPDPSNTITDTNHGQPRQTVHKDSPRPPPMMRQSSSSPAIRIRRLQPLSNGHMNRTSELVPVPEGVALSPIASNNAGAGAGAGTPKGPFAKVKSKLRHEHTEPVHDDPEKEAERQRKLAAINGALQPGEVATVLPDARGKPTLAAVPEDLMSPTSPEPAHTRSHPNPDPSESIMLPPNPPARNEFVVANEIPGVLPGKLGKKSWNPFARHNKPVQDTEKNPTVARDYGAADPIDSTGVNHGQYTEDIVDWLEVIG
jgi:hypothetical protein